MATVYRATDTRLGRDVALKVMHPHLAEGTQGADFIARFEREAQAAARLAHPGLVSVYDQGHDGRYAYLTMELVDGVTLRSLLDSGQDIDAATALGITQSIIEALTVAHSVGMVHRDIKPENVLVSTQGSVKLTDFGLARAVTDISSTATGTFFGTVAYIGPELVTHGHADSRTDLYAVGIMTYELLTGRQPFTAQTPVNIAFKHVNDPMPVLVSAKGEAFPAQINNFITSLTAKDPDERPADATEALTLLRSTLANLAGEDPATYHRSALEQRDHLAALVTGTMTADTSSDLHTPASPAEASHTHVLSPTASSPATPPHQHSHRHPRRLLRGQRNSSVWTSTPLEPSPPHPRAHRHVQPRHALRSDPDAAPPENLRDRPDRCGSAQRWCCWRDLVVERPWTRLVHERPTSGGHARTRP